MRWIIRNWSGLSVTTILVIVISCAPPPIEDNCQQVTIVSVTHSEETGSPDWYTIVEFPDKTRRYRYNKWGEVGDSFCARKYESTNWR